MDKCIFCEIAQVPAGNLILTEDDDFISFLDIRPVFLGHSLIIPKQHFVTLYDLPERMLQAYFQRVQVLGKAVETALSAQGSFVAMNNIVSQSVPHLHVHIIPRNKKDGLKGFFWPRHQYTELEMVDTQQKIKDAIKLVSF